MRKYFKNLYKALIGKSSSGQVDELLDGYFCITGLESATSKVVESVDSLEALNS